MFAADHARILSVVLENIDRHTLARSIGGVSSPGSVPVTTCSRTLEILREHHARSVLVSFEPNYFDCHPHVPDRTPGFAAYVRLHLAGHFLRVTSGKLWTYLKEFEFRYNRLDRPSEIFWDLIGGFPDLRREAVAGLEARNFIPAIK